MRLLERWGQVRSPICSKGRSPHYTSEIGTYILSVFPTADWFGIHS